MSTLFIYTVHDSKAAAFITPFFQPNHVTACRSFGHAASDENHDFGRFPADYTLLEIGSFDSETGELTVHPMKKNLGNALQHQTQPAMDLAEPAAVAELRNEVNNGEAK